MTATRLEYVAARLRLPHATKVYRAGIGLCSVPATDMPDSTLISCGLAGSLSSDLAPGTVVIPDEVGLEDGTVVRCSEELTEALRDAGERA
ncbi:MAG: hypothetical protein ACRDFS_13760, partial [Chloroflexota bacterium]